MAEHSHRLLGLLRQAVHFRGDAAFAKPKLYELLEAEEICYVIRLPANTVLQERIGHLLTRPVGRPPNKPQVFFASFSYQAQSWARPRRVVAKVEWHQGELYPRVGFIVTNLKRPAKRVSKFYNGRGTAEQWIRRASMRCAGRGCPATPSATTPCGSSSTPWPTTSPTSYAPWRCRRRSTMVADDAAREAGQDRRPHRAPRSLRRLPAGRGGGAAGAVRRDPAPDRPAQAKAAPDMSEASKVSSNPTGEVRRRSHKYVPNQARSGLALPRERCDDPSVAFTGLRGLPDAPNRRILAMQPSPSGGISAKPPDDRLSTIRANRPAVCRDRLRTAQANSEFGGACQPTGAGGGGGRYGRG